MRSLRLWLPVVLWATLILWASNDTFSASNSRDWLLVIAGYEVPRWIHFSIRKMAHVTEYAILAILAFRAAAGTWNRRTRLAFTAALLISIAVASTDEYRQSLSRARRGALDDVVLDVAAAAIAATVMARRKG